MSFGVQVSELRVFFGDPCSPDLIFIVSPANSLTGLARLWFRSWVDGRRDFVPDLNVISVGVLEEHVRFSGNEVTRLCDRAPSGTYREPRLLDVHCALEPESKVRDTALLPGAARAPFEHQDVPAPGGLRLDELFVLVHGDHAEH